MRRSLSWRVQTRRHTISCTPFPLALRRLPTLLWRDRASRGHAGDRSDGTNSKIVPNRPVIHVHATGVQTLDRPPGRRRVMMQHLQPHSQPPQPRPQRAQPPPPPRRSGRGSTSGTARWVSCGLYAPAQKDSVSAWQKAQSTDCTDGHVEPREQQSTPPHVSSDRRSGEVFR